MRFKISTRLLSVLMSVVLLGSLSVPALASDYSDVSDDRWSAQYIADLAKRGILTGYSDGAYRPTNLITAAEALAVLSRFYSLGDEVKSWIYEDYGAYVEKHADSSLSWAYDELAVCLAAGIITESELASLNLTGAIEKQLLSVFLVRAVQLEKTALSLAGTELEFSDAKDISAAYTGYVALLVSLGIVTGGDGGNFLPHSGVTREVTAAMLSRTLAYIEGIGAKLSIAKYEGMSKVEGIIYSAGSGVLRLRLGSGLIREFAVPSSASVSVNGEAKILSSLYNGSHAIVTLADGAVSDVKITSDTSVTWVQGNLASVTAASGGYYIYLADLATGTKTRYDLTSSTVITQNGKTVAASALTTPYFVTLKLVNNTAAALISRNNDCEISGTITALDYGTTVTLKVSDTNGALWYFPLDISNLPSITRGETAISIDRLSVGSKVIVAVDDSKVKSISSEDSENTVTGELMSVTTTTDATTWVIKDKNGKSWDLKLDANASVYSGSKAILLSAVGVGATVKVTVYGDTITEIYLISAASSTSKVTGTVLAVDSSKKTITLLVSGKLVYVDASSAVAIIKSSTGRTIGLSGITAESTVVAYGSYTNSVSFSAVTIIMES